MKVSEFISEFKGFEDYDFILRVNGGDYLSDEELEGMEFLVGAKKKKFILNLSEFLL